MQGLASNTFSILKSFSDKLRNSLPASVFSSSYDVTSFKREVSKYLSQTFGELLIF
ncbi:hypothetical protein E2C01_089778 [Portunus trituberculatus]|uniref:Uncharacterized protein n=1 Tax=Portunus trituberculatus TaxID=210409 RepID=A0A5B7J9R0_PORTR|nr:hypothetical protein [Portunus trituberculatus]